MASQETPNLVIKRKIGSMEIAQAASQRSFQLLLPFPFPSMQEYIHILAQQEGGF